MKSTSSPIGTQRQTAGFAISDILELDRNNRNSQELEPMISENSLYPSQDLTYLRHWTTIPEHGNYNFSFI